MQVVAQKEHHWLQQLVGEWTYEGEAIMGPGQPPMKHAGTENVRSIGGVWVQGEGSCEGPDGGTATTLLTLGYDPMKQRFVGTFIASMMTYLWIYEGTLDVSGTILTLAAEGPSFAMPGKIARYQDLVEVHKDGSRTLTSRMQLEDGTWCQFMTARYRRR